MAWFRFASDAAPSLLGARSTSRARSLEGAGPGAGVGAGGVDTVPEDGAGGATAGAGDDWGASWRASCWTSGVRWYT